MKSEFKLTHLELYISRSLVTNRCEAMFYVPEHLKHNAVHALDTVVNSCEQKVRYETLSACYYSLMNRVLELSLSSKCLARFNSHNYSQVYNVPCFVQKWVWVYSKESERNRAERYPSEKA